MPQYINKEIRQQYRHGRIVQLRDRKQIIRVAPELHWVVTMLETMTDFNKTGYPYYIRITSLIRSGKNKFSLHPFGYAIDLEIRNPQNQVWWTPQFKAAVGIVLTALRSLNPFIQYEFEENATGGPHIHIEYDNPEIKRELRAIHDKKEAWYQIAA